MSYRIAQYLFIIIVLLTLNFFLPRMMPGDPISYLVGDPGADAPLLMTEEMRQNLLRYYELDRPLGEQFQRYLSNLLRGELGWSISQNAPVAQVILGRLRWSLLLGGCAAAIYVPLGIVLGAVAAWHSTTPAGPAILGSVFFLGSWPSYFLGMLFIVFLSLKLGLFPIGGATSTLSARSGVLWSLVDVIHHGALPCATLVLGNLPGITLLVRNSTMGLLGHDFVRAAKAKGLRQRRVLIKHVLPNAMLPLVTMIAMRLGFLVAGSVTVEVVFAYPGMGALITTAGIARDYPLLQGIFLIIMLLIVGFNLLADLLYTRLDPRVRATL